MASKNYIIHPILFSAYPILFYYSHNIGQLRLDNVIEPLALMTAATIGVWFFLRIILKDWLRSGAILSFFLVLFFSYGHARTNIDLPGAAYYLPVIWLVLLLSVSLAIIRSR
jgi:hypothetical protein